MKKTALGIDLGGTKLALALVNNYGKVIGMITVHDHIKMNEDEVVAYTYKLANKLLTDNKLSMDDIYGVGACFPGHVRFKEGITITTSNLKGFKNYHMKEALEKKFNKIVTVDNDANAQTYAVHKFGAGRNYDDMIFMTISTGIGGGIIIDNKLYRGMTGSAGEFGHMIINHDSTTECTCGNHGCLMCEASGSTIAKIFHKYFKLGYTSEIINEKEILNYNIDGKLLKRGLDNNDLLCKLILSKYTDHIAVGLYNIFQIFNPPIIVLGGGLMKLGPLFFEEIKSKFNSHTKNMIHDDIDIRLSELGDTAGVIGAAAIVMDTKLNNNNSHFNLCA